MKLNQKAWQKNMTKLMEEKDRLERKVNIMGDEKKKDD